jgi:hypothetical protein
MRKNIGAVLAGLITIVFLSNGTGRTASRRSPATSNEKEQGSG